MLSAVITSPQSCPRVLGEPRVAEPIVNPRLTFIVIMDRKKTDKTKSRGMWEPIGFRDVLNVLEVLKSCNSADLPGGLLATLNVPCMFTQSDRRWEATAGW